MSDDRLPSDVEIAGRRVLEISSSMFQVFYDFERGNGIYTAWVYVSPEILDDNRGESVAIRMAYEMAREAGL